MINLFNTHIDSLSIHRVGNKSRNEAIFLSEQPFNLNDEIVPFIDLRNLFFVDISATTRAFVVIVKHSNRQSGLVVDEIFGEIQSVIKPMGSLLGKVKGISGSTILGNGDVALILDIHALIAQVENANVLT